MKKVLISLLSVFITVSGFAVVKVQNTPTKATVAVTKVVATNSLTQTLKAKGGLNSLNRIMESMNANLSSALLATRKFEIITRTDIDALINEQQFGESGNVDMKTAAKAGKLKGAKYIVTVSIDDYQDYMRKRKFATLNKTTEVRVIRYGAVANLIDATTGSIKESANFVISNEGVRDDDMGATTSGGDLTDSVIASMARSMCENIALKFCDVIFPAKVIGKSGSTVMFNRGEGSGVNVGDVFGVYAVGEAMVDPDTGEVLGVEETLIGKIKVISVLPKYSKGVVVGEDNGIAKLQILRKIVVAPAQPVQSQNEEL